MKKYVDYNGVEYEFVGEGTHGADRCPVTILKKVLDGSLEVFDSCVMHGFIMMRGGIIVPLFKEIKQPIGEL